MVNLPTRSQIEAWSTNHLEQAASVWGKRADVIAENYDKAQSALNGLRWTGAAGDQARDRYFRDLVDMRRGEDLLRQAATTARNGANDIGNAKQAALDAIRRAEFQLFDVSDDLHVTDRLPKIPGPFQWLRELEARVVESDVHAKALQLAATDERVGNAVKSFSNPLREFTFSGFGPVPDAPNSPGGPTITGPAGPLQFEQDKYDLQVGFPDGKGPTFGGDPQTHDNHWNPVDGLPRDPDSERAEHQPPDGTRSIPTGTAVGPNGERFGFFSYPVGKAPPGTNPYSTPGEAWDFSDPNNPKPLGLVQYPGPDGKMSPIYQPSGAYDKTTGRMVVVGNTTNSNGKIERVLFESDPIKPGDPPDQWLHTLHSSGTIQGMPGARENQLVALDGGGFALVGSDNTDVNDPSRTAVSAITASSADGLRTAVPTTLIQGAPSDHGVVSPYGPSVIGTTYDPVTGKEVIDLRVSTWDGINQIQPDPNNPHYPYDPKTYTTTFTVQH